MTYLSILLSCLAISFLVVKLYKYVLSVSLILIAAACIGMLMIPWNMDLGIQVITICVALLFIIIVVCIFAGGISALIVAPIVLLLHAVKSVFTK